MGKSGRRFRRLLSVLLLSTAGMAALAGFSGCSSATGFYGQQQTSYTLTVTATSGALSHSTTVVLTVETIG
jgi:ABC-type glycerol-3-phosphate transport system substrate-binding protein